MPPEPVYLNFLIAEAGFASETLSTRALVRDAQMVTYSTYKLTPSGGTV